MAISTIDAIQVDRKQKHTALNEAILQLSTVTCLLRDLNNRIGGHVDTPDADKVAPALPECNLEYVLDTGDSRIRDSIQTAQELIKQIEAKLF